MGDWNGYCWLMTGVAFLSVLASIFVGMHHVSIALNYSVETKLLWRIVLSLLTTIDGLKNYICNLRDNAWMKNALKIDKELAKTFHRQAMKELESLVKVNPIYQLPERITRSLDLEPDKRSDEKSK